MAEPPIGGGPKPPIGAPPPAIFCNIITAIIIIIGFFAIMAIGFPPPIMAAIGLPNFGARCFPFASASLLVASEDAAITATASAAAANFLNIVMVSPISAADGIIAFGYRERMGRMSRAM